jgi:serine/threonine-protein kinase
MAKLLGDSPVHTVSGTPIGTPLYMSPEQARGERVDKRSDVYALGVLAYELLVGRLPFTGDTTVAVLMAHIIQEAPRPSEAAPDLPALLDAPILSMLDKDPEKRPASAGAALRALCDAARAAGLPLASGALHLPKPEQPAFPTPSDGPDTWLEQAGPTESLASTESANAKTRPLWPFGAALVVLGAALAVVVLRPGPAPAPAAKAEPLLASASAEAAVAVPSTPLPAPSAVDALVAPAAPAPSLSAAAPAPPAQRRNEPKKKVAPSSAAAIPQDLENPFR